MAQAAQYILPAATTSTLGGVMVGNGLNVSSNGLLTVSGGGSGGCSLPVASASTLGA